MTCAIQRHGFRNGCRRRDSGYRNMNWSKCPEKHIDKCLMSAVAFGMVGRFRRAVAQHAAMRNRNRLEQCWQFSVRKYRTYENDLMKTICGFVAVVGRPNVGKSTLINAIMGRKISIVTNKPQTTRHRILAVHTDGDTQIIFVDTPGIHRKANRAMNRMMNRTASNALADADLVLFVGEATRWTEEDDDVLKRLKSVDAPVIALLNKVDRVHPKERLFEALASMSARHEFAEIYPISALKKSNLKELMAAIPAYLPESPPLFPEEMHTDRGKEFQAAEVIREKLTLMLHQ